MIMVKGRGKGKKYSNTNDEDIASGEEEKIPVQKKRGRPLKLRKEEVNEDEYAKVEEKETEKATDDVLNEEMRSSMMTENGRKRKGKGKFETGKTENENGRRSSPEGITKPNGYRSRRKGKPCRAAEAGVECQLYFG